VVAVKLGQLCPAAAIINNCTVAQTNPNTGVQPVILASCRLNLSYSNKPKL
jgi:hypothetical protein